MGRALNLLRQPMQFLLTPRAPEGLAQRVTLAFGFMAFIPLLMMIGALVWYVLPHVDESVKETLGLIVVAIIVSIFVGYSVLKRTMRGVMAVVRHARTATGGQLVEPSGGNRDEIVELTRTFNRITQELEQKIEALESSRALIKRLLARISTAIVSFEGIDTVLEMILEQSCAAMEAQAGSLVILNDASQQLEPRVAWTLDGERPATQTLNPGEGIAGVVASTMRPMRVTGSLASIGLGGEPSSAGAVLCVPLAVRERPLGALAVFRASVERAFTEDDEVLLTNIGSQVAVAIENYQLNQDIEQTYLEAIMALALAVEAKEAYTAGHSKRVAFYAEKIAELMGLDGETRRLIHHAGLLHDVGKIGVKDAILLKPGALDPEELHIMRQHPSIGEAILKPLRSLGKVAEMVHCHHEHYDGSGYPRGLKGDQIPLEARILVVADSYDSIVTDRPYRKRLGLQEAKDELRKWAGTRFDPKVVQAFLRFLAEKEQRSPQASGASQNGTSV